MTVEPAPHDERHLELGQLDVVADVGELEGGIALGYGDAVDRLDRAARLTLRHEPEERRSGCDVGLRPDEAVGRPVVAELEEELRLVDANSALGPGIEDLDGPDAVPLGLVSGVGGRSARRREPGRAERGETRHDELRAT